ncbi:hypothetical protein P9112_009377 [Eukaryota sp. TZLM1-RC]
MDKPDITTDDIIFEPTDSDDVQRVKNAYAGFDIDEVIILVAAVSKYIKAAKSHRVNWATVADGLGEGWTPERAQLIWRYIAYPHKRTELEITPIGIVNGPEEGTFQLNHEDSDWDGSGCKPPKVERSKEERKKGRARKASEAMPSAPPSPENVPQYPPSLAANAPVSGIPSFPGMGTDEGLPFTGEMGFMGWPSF